MRKALEDFAQGEEGLGQSPVREKAELFDLLDDALAEGMALCQEKDVHLGELLEGEDVFQNM